MFRLFTSRTGDESVRGVGFIASSGTPLVWGRNNFTGINPGMRLFEFDVSLICTRELTRLSFDILGFICLHFYLFLFIFNYKRVLRFSVIVSKKSTKILDQSLSCYRRKGI